MATEPRNEKTFEWDDFIENDGMDFVRLPEGDYPFTIVGVAKGRHTPGPKGVIPRCNKAIITIRVNTPEGSYIDIKDNLYLTGSQEWKLCQFHCCIGARHRGEKMKMEWESLVGRTGICHIKPCVFKAADGTEHVANNITHWLPRTDESASVQQAMTTSQLTPAPAQTVTTSVAAQPAQQATAPVQPTTTVPKFQEGVF